MFTKKDRHYRIILIALTVLFAIGLILGTVALFYIPDEVTLEAQNAFGYESDTDFFSLFKENLFLELLWIVAIWILGSVAPTAPITASVIGLRGFVMGFSVAFIISGGGDWIKFVTGCILPQCATMLPVMSIFTIQCITLAIEKRYRENHGAVYFLRGALFIGVTALASLVETWLMTLLKGYLF